jgi:hypothetical protein
MVHVMLFPVLKICTCHWYVPKYVIDIIVVVVVIVIVIIITIFKYRKLYGVTLSTSSDNRKPCGEMSSLLVMLKPRKQNGLLLRSGYGHMVKS